MLNGVGVGAAVGAGVGGVGAAVGAGVGDDVGGAGVGDDVGGAGVGDGVGQFCLQFKVSMSLRPSAPSALGCSRPEIIFARSFCFFWSLG